MSSCKILIIVNKLIGDNVAALNSVYSLFHHYSKKGFSFHILGYPYSMAIYEKMIHPEKIFYFNDSKNYSKKIKRNALKLILKLRKEKYQMAFILPGGFFFAFISFLSRIKIRIGHKSDLRSFLLTHPAPISKNLPNYQNYDNLMKVLPETIFYRKAPLAKTKLNFRRHTIKEPYVVIAPRASEENKIWPGEKFKKLSEKIKNKYKTQMIYVGLEIEKKAITKIISEGDLNLAGSVSLSEVFYLIEKCQFFISNDSGLAHVAGQLGTLSFIVVGPSNLVLSRPRGEKTHLIYKKIPNISNVKRKRSLSKEASIEEVTVEQVFGEIEKYFSPSPPNTPK